MSHREDGRPEVFTTDRRHVLQTGLLSGVGLLLGGSGTAVARQPAKRSFEISVAGWSLHREIWSGELVMRDAFRVVREELDLGALELVNTLLEVPTLSYVDQLRRESERYEVAVPLIMCDAEGDLGDPDPSRRQRSIRHHTKWIHVAADLGCHAIRVNWRGLESGQSDDEAAVEDFLARSAETYRELIEAGAAQGIDILIENHGGLSSDPRQLARLMERVDSPHFGTLPDFGNFPEDVDRYRAVDALMPWAKAVSAKCWAFGPDGEETSIDFERMLSICVDRHQYHGYIGIEFEGPTDERQGIRACRDLLRRLRG